MLGREHGAAILIGQRGGFIGADLPGVLDNVNLIKPDQRPEYRHFHHLIRGCQGFHGLAGHLAHRLARDQRQAFFFPGNPLGNAHHVSPHDQGGVILGALLMNLHLNLRKGHHVNLDPAAVIGKNLRQIQHLLLGELAGVREGMIMHRHQLHPALGDHVSGHRAVNAAGKQQRRFSAGAHRHAAYRGIYLAVQIRLIPNLNGQNMLRLMHVHLQMILVAHQHIFAHLPVDLGRIQEIMLVCPPGFHLERAAQRPHHQLRLLADAVKIVLFHFDGRAYGMHAEHLAHPLHAALGIVHIADEHPGIMQPDLAPKRPGRLPHPAYQRPQEIRAVQALQINLAISNHQQLAHDCKNSFWARSPGPLSSLELGKHRVVLPAGRRHLLHFRQRVFRAKGEPQRGLGQPLRRVHRPQHRADLLLVG